MDRTATEAHLALFLTVLLALAGCESPGRSAFREAALHRSEQEVEQFPPLETMEGGRTVLTGVLREDDGGWTVRAGWSPGADSKGSGVRIDVSSLADGASELRDRAVRVVCSPGPAKERMPIERIESIGPVALSGWLYRIEGPDGGPLWTFRCLGNDVWVDLNTAGVAGSIGELESTLVDIAGPVVFESEGGRGETGRMRVRGIRPLLQFVYDETQSTGGVSR